MNYSIKALSYMKYIIKTTSYMLEMICMIAENACFWYILNVYYFLSMYGESKELEIRERQRWSISSGLAGGQI